MKLLLTEAEALRLIKVELVASGVCGEDSEVYFEEVLDEFHVVIDDGEYTEDDAEDSDEPPCASAGLPDLDDPATYCAWTDPAAKAFSGST